MMAMRANTEPLFVYGTLRVGESLSELLPSNLPRYNATVRGRLHYSPHTRGYPVLLPSDDPNDRVHGEVVWVNLDNADVTYVVMMEIGAGYSATWAQADLNIGGHVEALTFTWHPANGTGELITDGDWTERDASWRAPKGRHRCLDCNTWWDTREEAVECGWDHDLEDAID